MEHLLVKTNGEIIVSMTLLIVFVHSMSSQGANAPRSHGDDYLPPKSLAKALAFNSSPVANLVRPFQG